MNTTTIAGLAGVLIFAGASATSNGTLDRFALSTIAGGSGVAISIGIANDRRRHCQDETAIAVKRARAEAAQHLAAIEANHSLETSKLRKNFNQQLADLNAEKIALQRDHETRLTQTITRHTSALQGSQTEHARTLVAELRERDDRIDTIARDHANTINRLHEKIATLTGQLEQEKLNRDELLRLEYGREVHTLELQQKDDTIAALQGQIDGLQSRLIEVSESIDGEFDEATKAGFKEASEQYEKAIAELERQHDHALQKLQTRIGQLETQLDKRKSRAAFEQSLTTLENLLDDRLMPLLITGNQRAGKGTTGIEAARIYGGRSDLGAVIVGFDPSEGMKETGTFRRAGIPTLSDAYHVLELMEAIEAHKHTRPLTSEPQAASTPRIILAIDELGTCITALDKESRTRFGELFKHTYQNWLKFGIVPILLGHSPQIQNLECGGVQLLNGGHAHTAFTNILVCDVIEKFAKDNGGMTDDLNSYLQTYEGYFTSAYFQKGKLHPMKHASHHGFVWSDNVAPHDKSKVRLAPCPSWFPHSVRSIYTPDYDRAVAEERAGASKCRPGAIASTPQSPDRPTRAVLHAEPWLTKWGAMASELGFSEDELRALVACVEADKNQGESLRSAMGIKSRSGNPDSAYQRGRTLFQAIKTALITV